MMLESIVDLEEGLHTQLEDLAREIRSVESSLINTKEGYLKVQGALEILKILKDKVKSEDDQISLSAALE